MANVRKKHVDHEPAQDASVVKEVAAPGISVDGAHVQPQEAVEAAEQQAQAQVEEVAADVEEAAEAAVEEYTDEADDALDIVDDDDDDDVDDADDDDEANEAEEDADDDAPKKQADAAPKMKATTVISTNIKQSRKQSKERKQRREELAKKRAAEIESQRGKNERSFEHAMAISQADDDELAALSADIADVEFEDEFLNDEQLAAKAAKPRRANMPRSRFTTQNNNITGDAATLQLLVDKQRHFFDSGITLPDRWREQALNRLHSLFDRYETPLLEAITRDMGISKEEAYLTEIAPVHQELYLLRKRRETWTKPKRVLNPHVMFTTPTKEYRRPYGVTLIINSWQSPVAQAYIALAEAICAGNVVVLKNSARNRRCNEVLGSALVELFKTDYVKFIFGGSDMDEDLLRCSFDKVCYVGPRENREAIRVATAGCKAPVTMLLDGNNPCYVDHTFKTERAAERIMWGKLLRAGQTRLNPSFAYVSDRCIKKFINRTYAYVKSTYGDDPIHSKDYPRMFSRKEYDEACAILDNLGPKDEIVYGGERDPKTLRIAPTVVLIDSLKSPILKKRIIGPILPVVAFTRPEEAFAAINKLPTPPAFYVFSKNKRAKTYAMFYTDFSQGCFNDTMVQVMNRRAPHGATGDAGAGMLGGKAGVMEFSARRTMVTNMFGGKLKGVRKAPYGNDHSRIKRKYRYHT